MEVRIVQYGPQFYLLDVATRGVLDVWRTDGQPVLTGRVYGLLAGLKLARILDNE